MGWRMLKAGLLLAFTAGLALAVFCNALANITANRQPETALKASQDRPAALNALAEQKLGSPQPNADELRGIALRSLRQQLLNPAAMRTLGLARLLKDDAQGGRKAIEAAERMSRRDLGTQLWLIENSVTEGNVAEALRHYDIALRASQASSQLLFPILAQAISDPEIRFALKPYVLAKTEWVPQFLIFAVNEGKLEEAARTVLAAGRVPAGTEFAPVSGMLIPNLAATRKWDLLRDYYLATPGADATVLRTAAFTNATTNRDIAPLSWATTDQANLYAEFQSDGEKGEILTAAAEDTSNGWLAQKILFLPAGRFELSTNYEWSELADTGSASIAVYCGDNQGGAPIARLPLVPGKTAARGAFQIPSNCAAQVIKLEMSGGDDKRVSLWARQISVVPAQ